MVNTKNPDRNGSGYMAIAPFTPNRSFNVLICTNALTCFVNHKWYYLQQSHPQEQPVVEQESPQLQLAQLQLLLLQVFSLRTAAEIVVFFILYRLFDLTVQS